MYKPTKTKAFLRLASISRRQRYATTASTSNPNGSIPPPWRPSHVLDEWVLREARPISLRQLTVFGRTLTESRLLSSANYVREELPTRIAHRLRNMQTLPYSAFTNPHMSYVYELYYTAFERFRKVPYVRTVEDNDKFCEIVKRTLNEHVPVIRRLAMGILEIQDSLSSEECDRVVTTLLRSRISRRVIAEQHLALTDTFHSPWHFPDSKTPGLGPEDDSVGEIFLRCNVKETIEKCAKTARELSSRAYGPHVTIPEIVLIGNLDPTFPYIPSHLEYMIGELLRNSIQAVVEQRGLAQPPPIEVLICEAAQHVIIRVSDQGGGVDREILPYIWSFVKGPRRYNRLQNLIEMSQLAETKKKGQSASMGSLPSLSNRPPGLKLGMGLPMSKLYAEYWAGSLEIHSLEGYGCDAFLQISRFGNKNEVLSTRASMDAV